MDTLTFTSEIIKSLAWPIAVVALAFMLRKPVVELIPFLRKLKFKELELDFSKEIAELKADTTNLEPLETQKKISQTNTESRLLNLVPISTRAAIMEAWLEVESAATETASSFWNQPASDIFKNFHKVGEYLLQCKVIDKKQLETFNTLKQLRNKAAHAEELNLSETDAKSYIELASSLAAHIRATV
jgi:hypothetical protein